MFTKKYHKYVALMLALIMTTLSLALAPLPTVAAVDNDSVIEIAGETLTSSQIQTIRDGFATKAQGKNLGTAGDITTAREIILYADYGTDSKSRIVYNFAMEDYFIVDADYYSTYVEGDTFRRLGAPTTDKGTFNVSGKSKNQTISNGSYTAQIFETGIILTNGENVVSYVGAVEANSNGYVLHPLIDDQDIMKSNGNGGYEYFGNIDGELHPLKDADLIVSGSGTDKVYELYANYRSCCAYVVYDADYNITYQIISVARNYFLLDNQYVAKLLPDNCYSVSNFVRDGSDPVESNALDYYVDAQPQGTKESLIALFEDCYRDMLADGFIAGYRCSKIKMWDLLVLDLKYGDGTTGFSETGTGDRERMTCMVYNPEQNKVYPVNNAIFMIFKEDDGVGRNALGYPQTAALTNQTIGGITYAEIQIFRYGYIYKTAAGNYVGMAGYVYDADNNVFLPVATPNIPDRYGAEIGRTTMNDVIYINYEKGAIKCQLSINKSKYYYTYYHGRNFDLTNGQATLLPMNSLLKYSQLVSKGAMPTDNSGTVISYNDVIKPLIYAKYVELFDNGFFCGFVEEEFKGAWNNVFAQQFVVSDSTAMIFGEERPNVCAICYNPKTNEVYLLKDDAIFTWQRNYSTAGAPTSDEYQVDGCDFWFQTFDFGMTIRQGNLIVYTEDFQSPQAYVDEMNDNPLICPTHKNKEAKGYIG